MRANYTAVVERDADTGLYVGYVPGFSGAHSQGETLDELHRNLQEVIAMLLEDGEPVLAGEFAGIQTIQVGWGMPGRCGSAGRTSSSGTRMTALPQFPSTLGGTSRPRCHVRLPEMSGVAIEANVFAL